MFGSPLGQFRLLSELELVLEGEVHQDRRDSRRLDRGHYNK
jgi:hypothetical protein